MTEHRWRKFRGFPEGVVVGRDRYLDEVELDAWDAAQVARAAAKRVAAEQRKALADMEG